MKKIGLVALFALLLAGCDDGGEKKAQENLRKAEAALEKENFNEAKLHNSVPDWATGYWVRTNRRWPVSRPYL